jgi:GrpB-like predicted nucleotidyltransferase (UPF0157 family)
VNQAVIGPYPHLPAECVAQDPRADEVARRVAALITARLPSVTVEHIGSTAVPGCPGKGVVDLMLIYPDGQLQAAKGVLDALGFQRQTTRDPFPEERPMRTGALGHEGGLFLLHVHVLAADSGEVGQLRSFRDRLRADPELKAKYVACKRGILAEGVTDPVTYAERKSKFFETMIEKGQLATQTVPVQGCHTPGRPGDPSGPLSTACTVS